MRASRTTAYLSFVERRSLRPLGTSVPEALVVLFLIGIVALLASGALAGRRGVHATTAAARELASTFQALRFRAVTTRRHHGLFFERDAAGWRWFVVRDENGNGLRTAEIRDGVDLKLSGPHRITDRIAGVELGFPPGPAPSRIPPRSGTIADLTDPVKFGVSNVVSFSPLGRASSGTLYLSDGHHQLRGVVLFGPTVRVRVWRYDAREGRWRL